MDSIKDGFSILKGKGRPGSSVRTAIVKATKNDKIPPKEKHVKVLIAKTFENKTNMGHMIKHFNVRLETRDWITAAKALTVIHRIFREGNERFIKSISRTGILDMQFFQDDNFPRQTQFVLQYAKYLSEKAKNYRQFDKEYEKSSENFDNYDYKLILEIIPALQTQFEALLEFEDKMDLISSRISLHPFGLLLKDSFRLFTGLNKIFVKVIGEYDKMSKSEANHLLTFYKNFAKEVDSLIKLYSKSQSFTKGLPEIKPLPTTMIEILEDYIKGAPTQSRDNGSKREVRKDVKDTKQKEKPKEKVKKEKKPVVESESSEDGNGNENSSEEQDEGSENLLIDFTSMNKSEPMFNPMMFQNNFTQVHHQPQSQQLQQYLQQQQMLQQQQLQLQQQFVQQQQQQNNNVNSNSSFFNQNQSQSTPQNKTPQNFNTNVSTTTGSGGQFTFNNTNNNSSFFNNNNTNGSFNNTQVNNNNTQNNNLFGNNNQNNNTFNNQNNQNNNLFNNNNSNTFNNNNNFNGNKNSTTSLFDFNTTTNVNTNNTNNFNNNTQSGNSNNNLFNFNVTTSTTQGNNNNNLFSSNPSPNAPTSTPLSQQPIMGTSNSNNNLLFTNNNNNLNNNNNNFMFNQNNHISNPLSNNYNINQNQNNMQYQFLLMQQQQQQQQQLNNPLFSNNSMQQPPPQRKLKESTPPSSSGSGQMDPSQQQFSFLNPLNTRTNPFAGN